MATRTSSIYRQSSYRWGSLCLFAAIATILGAFAFEHIGGYAPCPLCLQQRYAYYVGIPLLFLALVLLSAGRRSIAVGLLFLVS
ncbi:MAG: disulfide bond formation protein B, partial [Alphaproteobacteria bacterium]|nr:disulfide bond formation protein B [Alphaproteobacteria bacterium]